MADRYDIGAGYAGASAAGVATSVFFLIAVTSHAFGSPIGSDWEFLIYMAILAFPLVVPAAFIAGIVTWRTLPEHIPHFGRVGGFVATIGTYIVSLGLLFIVMAVLAARSGNSAPIFESMVFVWFAGLGGFAMTFWLTLPIGCVSGAIYERVGRGSGVSHRSV